MANKDMNIGRAAAIFCNIFSSKESDDEKIRAIKAVIGMETYNGISKQALINALGWLSHKAGAVMEKCTPKIPNTWGDGCDDEGRIIYDMYDCPNCGKSYEIDYEKYDHCPACGQAIDWSGLEESEGI